MPFYKIFCSYFVLFFVLFIHQDHFVSSNVSYPTSEEYGFKCRTKTINYDYGVVGLDQETLQYQDFCLLIKTRSNVTVRFLNFKFGQNEFGRCTDFVEIRSTEGYSFEPRVKYCGSRSPPLISSGDGSLVVWVHRESQDRYVDRSDNNLCVGINKDAKENWWSGSTCQNHITLDRYTFITPPSFCQNQASNYRTCSWTVALDDTATYARNHRLQVQLSNWTVQQQVLGAWSRFGVKIRDGREGRLLASFDQQSRSDYATDILLTTTGPEVYITYSSTLQDTHFFYSFFNMTVKVKGICIPGTLPCGDGETCYTHKQVCDGKLQCSTGYDELGCRSCRQTEFWCGPGSDNNLCYSLSDRCNGFKNCPSSNQDEENCKTCGPGSFLCESDNKCIYERWRCDSDYDCSNGSDEEGCTYAASRRVITAAVIGSLVCSLLLVIALGCTCKLYSLRASHHRHPHHQLRATPLTRVEREIFARQAPPTYDMTVTGVSSENANSRSQRNRRRRSRRYQFQRTAPADIGHQCNNDSRQEGVATGNTGATSPTNVPNPSPVDGGPTCAPRAPPTPQQQQQQQQQSTPTPGSQNNPRTDILQQFGELLFESIRSVPPTDLSSAQMRTSTPVSTPTRDNGTQTNSANSNGQQNPSSPTSNNQRSSSTSRRSNRSSSRSRSSRGSSSSSNPKNEQAKPLPKKKRILPVMVPAPCADVAVEEDMLACVYPCPPSYSQAVASGSRPDLNESLESRAVDESEETSVSMENQDEASSLQQTEDADTEFTPENDSLTTVTRSRFFPFSIGQAIRNIASASFARFQKNPYLQMRTEDSRRNSIQDHPGNDSTIDETDTFTPPTQPRPSASSDEDLIDCALDTQSLRHDSTDDLRPLNSVTTTTAPDTPTTSATSGKIFPQRKKLSFFTKRDTSDTDSLDMSDFTTNSAEQ